jgi:hypothetical protein
MARVLVPKHLLMPGGPTWLEFQRPAGALLEELREAGKAGTIPRYFHIPRVRPLGYKTIIRRGQVLFTDEIKKGDHVVPDPPHESPVKAEHIRVRVILAAVTSWDVKDEFGFPVPPSDFKRWAYVLDDGEDLAQWLVTQIVEMPVEQPRKRGRPRRNEGRKSKLRMTRLKELLAEHGDIWDDVDYADALDCDESTVRRMRRDLETMQ